MKKYYLVMTHHDYNIIGLFSSEKLAEKLGKESKKSFYIVKLELDEKKEYTYGKVYQVGINIKLDEMDTDSWEDLRHPTKVNKYVSDNWKYAESPISFESAMEQLKSYHPRLLIPKKKKKVEMDG